MAPYFAHRDTSCGLSEPAPTPQLVAQSLLEHVADGAVNHWPPVPLTWIPNSTPRA